MSNWKKVDADQLYADLTSVADAIRESPRFAEPLGFPNEYVSAIQQINAEYKALLDGTGTEVFVPEGITKIRDSAFYRMYDVTAIHIPEGVTAIGTQCFWDCGKLPEITFPPSTRTIDYAAFAWCGSLKMIDCWFTEINSECVFWGCSGLDALILRNTEMVATLANANTFESSKISHGTGYIYVPRSLVDSYKAATNWSTYASQIRAIEDYPEITGG